jgi:hypothetical protein
MQRDQHDDEHRSSTLAAERPSHRQATIIGRIAIQAQPFAQGQSL